ncbi:acyloxyacyl hydrolase [Ramlibacter tataouinensis]|uniref:acyloxyacyl hydrolase n=1 Tax=Ramlibacter tataouinensis TaxID=94132 RepID=UPI0022F38C1D|nr:acyloxyacyl hydrolase [Ramlibacter tataouinensis]WBY00032.1 acyloxyacyl hydrolase [Ramlibacter tataouinensis]
MRALTRSIGGALLASLFAAAAGAAPTEGLHPGAVFAQGGVGENGVQAAGIGLLWPWDWRAQAAGGEFSAQTELFVSQWRARGAAGAHEGYTQAGLVPLLRYRPDEGRSPWFVEGGIGLSVTDSLFTTPARTMGSRWNFSDNLAVGRNFGARGQHELSLRWQHTSNAGLKQPNPGLDLLMLRYSARF